MLSQFLVTEIYAFLLIFARIGAGLVLLPGLAEAYMMQRARLVIGVGVALALTPLYSGQIVVPASTGLMVFQLSAEILTGLMIGTICRILISTMHTAGFIVAAQSSLSTAMMFDITQAGQGTAVSNLMVIAGMVLLFVLNLHHSMLLAVTESYALVPMGAMPVMQDFMTIGLDTVEKAFRMAIQLSAPHLVVGTILYLAAGILARLVPQIQIFFLIMAPQIFLGFFVLFTIISPMLYWYAEYVKESLEVFSPG
jgi:flagellar biosynthesis protein FliR